MSLISSSTQAERERGLVWSEGFETAADVVANGGTRSGTSTINGSLSGTYVQMVSYTSIEPLNTYMDSFIASGGTIRFQFKPTTGAKTDFDRVFTWAADSTHGVAIGIQESTGDIRATIIGATTQWPSHSATITNANHWYDICLVWNGTNSAQLYIDGVVNSGAAGIGLTTNYDNLMIKAANGTMRNLQIYSKQLTAQEIADFANNATYNYLNEVDYYWPLDMENLLVSKFGDITLSNTNSVTKNVQTTGYLFSGSNYLYTATDIVIGTNDYTAVALIRCTISSPSSNGIMGSEGSGVGQVIPLYVKLTTGDLVTYISEVGYNGASGTQAVNDRNWHVVGVTADRSGNATFYVDGVSRGIADISAKVAVSVTWTNPRIGALASNCFSGDIAHVMLWNGKLLTDLQMKDLAVRLKRMVNKL